MLLADRFFQRHVVDHLAAGGVDEIRARPHPLEHRRIDDAPRAGIQREMDTEDVAALGDFLRRPGDLHRHGGFV